MVKYLHICFSLLLHLYTSIIFGMYNSELRVLPKSTMEKNQRNQETKIQNNNTDNLTGDVL